MEGDRYGRSWAAQSRYTRSATGGRCVLCGVRATATHHAYYGLGLWHFKLPIPGYEIPGWQLFGLCDRCHHHVHTGRRWHTFQNHWANRNTLAVLWRLRLGFLLRALLHNPKALLGLLAILCVLLVLPGVLTIAHVGTVATLGIAVILWSKA